MDPNAAYDLILSYELDAELDEATEAARGLWNWLVNGGFAPDRPPIPKSFCNHLREGSIYLSGLAHLCRGINRYLEEPQ